MSQLTNFEQISAFIILLQEIERIKLNDKKHAIIEMVTSKELNYTLKTKPHSCMHTDDVNGMPTSIDITWNRYELTLYRGKYISSLYINDTLIWISDHITGYSKIIITNITDDIILLFIKLSIGDKIHNHFLSDECNPPYIQIYDNYYGELIPFLGNEFDEAIKQAIKNEIVYIDEDEDYDDDEYEDRKIDQVRFKCLDKIKKIKQNADILQANKNTQYLEKSMWEYKKIINSKGEIIIYCIYRNSCVFQFVDNVFYYNYIETFYEDYNTCHICKKLFKIDPYIQLMILPVNEI
jgi:hypothetical protein